MTNGLSIYVAYITNMHGNGRLVNNVEYTTMIMKLMSTSAGENLSRYFDRIPTIMSSMVNYIHQICE